jgi:hypothetical protein
MRLNEYNLCFSSQNAEVNNFGYITRDKPKRFVASQELLDWTGPRIELKNRLGISASFNETGQGKLGQRGDIEYSRCCLLLLWKPTVPDRLSASLHR